MVETTRAPRLALVVLVVVESTAADAGVTRRVSGASLPELVDSGLAANARSGLSNCEGWMVERLAVSSTPKKESGITDTLDEDEGEDTEDVDASDGEFEAPPEDEVTTEAEFRLTMPWQLPPLSSMELTEPPLEALEWGEPPSENRRLFATTSEELPPSPWLPEEMEEAELELEFRWSPPPASVSDV